MGKIATETLTKAHKHTHNNHTAQVTKRDLGTTRMDVDLVVDDVVGRVDTMAKVLRKRRRK